MSNSRGFVIDPDDNVGCHRPDFRVGMTFDDGKPSYWIVAKKEVYVTDPSTKRQTRTVEEIEVEVSAEIWRDACRLLQVAEIRQLRGLLVEALDSEISDTIASSLKLIAEGQ